MQLMPYQLRIAFSRWEIYILWKSVIYAKNSVIVQPGMYVDMEMRHFLEGSLPDGVPKADAIIWEGLSNCARDP